MGVAAIVLRHKGSEDETIAALLHDAAAVCWGLKDFDQRDLLSRYFDPPLTKKDQKCVIREGWILGII